MAMKRRLLFMGVFIILFFVFAWMIFNPSGPPAITQNRPLLFVLAVAGVVPIYPLYVGAKRWRRFAKGLAVFTGGLVLTEVFIVAHYLFHLDNVWTRGILDLGQALNVLASVMIVWQAAKR